MTDAEFLRAFQDCTLREEAWTHCAHVRMAWLHLRQGVLEQVLPTVRAGIKRYNATLGKALAYHETITRGYLILIDDRMRRGGHNSFEDFCRANPDLLDRRLTALLLHYRQETLFCAPAAEAFVLPDLAPFPTRLPVTARP